MSETKDGGPAFPCPDMVQRDAAGAYFGAPVSSAGMSLRDWFAGRADEADIEAHQGEYISNPAFEIGGGTYQFSREQAKYRYADAMLSARTEGGADNG